LNENKRIRWILPALFKTSAKFSHYQSFPLISPATKKLENQKEAE
jgi:hypothetical protein